MLLESGTRKIMDFKTFPLNLLLMVKYKYCVFLCISVIINDFFHNYCDYVSLLFIQCLCQLFYYSVFAAKRSIDEYYTCCTNCHAIQIHEGSTNYNNIYLYCNKFSYVSLLVRLCNCTVCIVVTLYFYANFTCTAAGIHVYLHSYQCVNVYMYI